MLKTWNLKISMDDKGGLKPEREQFQWMLRITLKYHSSLDNRRRDEAYYQPLEPIEPATLIQITYRDHLNFILKENLIFAVMPKQRLDKLMVERGLAPSREKAQALIMAGQVVVGDHAAVKAGQQVSEEVEIRIKGNLLRYVSRGGLKLEKGLDTFGIDTAGRIAIDVGASTGGFTDCLLQRGAAMVYAVDVGYGQLAWKLRQDSRVVVLEKTNIRTLTQKRLDPLPDLAVIDASFISLNLVLPPTLALLKRPAYVVALVKPQFEVGKGAVGKGGIVRDPKQHEEVLARMEALALELGGTLLGICESPVTGADGNREFLMGLRLE